MDDFSNFCVGHRFVVMLMINIRSRFHDLPLVNRRSRSRGGRYMRFICVSSSLPYQQVFASITRDDWWMIWGESVRTYNDGSHWTGEQLLFVRRWLRVKQIQTSEGADIHAGYRFRLLMPEFPSRINVHSRRSDIYASLSWHQMVAEAEVRTQPDYYNLIRPYRTPQDDRLQCWSLLSSNRPCG